MLTIVSASLVDDAEFSAVAKNIEGEARSVAQVIVEQRPEGEFTVNATLK